MEKRFKLRFSRIFQSSFFSCRSKKNSDIIITNKPISNSTSLKISPSLISSKPPQLSSNYTPKLPLNSYPFLNSPISPLKSPPLSHLKDCLSRNKTKKKTPNSTKIKRKKNPTRPAAAPAPEEFGGAWWYGRDETEDETETLFSSRSLTSDSSISLHHRRRHRRRHGRRRPERQVKDGFFAVVKNSSDPYKDFKASMAEMVVEKKIFGGKELEELLQCFISLNSRHYHKVIFEVYSEIKEALFFL